MAAIDDGRRAHARRVMGRATLVALWAVLTAVLAPWMAWAEPPPAPPAPPPPPGANSEAARHPGVVRTRARFDQAFVDLSARLPPEAAGKDHPLHALHALVQFRNRSVGWLRMVGDGYVPLGAARPRSWMTVVPDGHPYRDEMYSVLQMTAEEEFYVVHIAEGEYDPTWAILFAVHEVTHLYDRDLGIQPLRPNRRQHLDAELRANRNEMAAAQLVSGGTFLPALDALLDEWEGASTADIDRLAQRLDAKAVARLSRPITRAPAASQDEDALRRGFLWIALVIRHADRTGAGDASIRAALGRGVPASSNEKSPL